MPSPPVALTIAGSDCSAGAGIQADLKTFQYHRVHGLTVLTSVVAESPREVAGLEVLPLGMIESQLDLMLASYPVRAAKTGMLCRADIVAMVAQRFAKHADVALVVDPVMIASAGASLLEPAAIGAYEKELFPIARLITPNLPEAERLLGSGIATADEMQEAAENLSSRYGCGVLLKGGHLAGELCVDVLACKGRVERFEQPRIAAVAGHGTGCSLSAAICARLALGDSLSEAVAAGRRYLLQTLKSAYRYRPAPAIGHLNQGTLPWEPGQLDL